MYTNIAKAFELLPSGILVGFVLCLFIGFISWAFWYAVDAFRNMTRG